MKIKKLIKDLPIQIYSGGDTEISGLCSNSKLVAPGNLFIAKKGSQDDGAAYIEEAIATGAVAVLTDMPNPFLKKITQLIHPNVQEMEGILAARYYEHPSHSLYTVGVTGTNGKTTISYLLKHLFDAAQQPSGLIGTIEYIVGDHHFEAERTTPDVITNHKLLKEMLKRGCKSALLEVSSHGLAQRRCDQIDFDAAIFTNLSQEHLDYHQTMDAYASEKAKLFTSLAPEKIAIVNFESPWTPKILRECKAQTLTFGFSPQADVYATSIELNVETTSFDVHYKGQKVHFCWGTIGRYNILNALAAIALCVTRGFPLHSLPAMLSTFISAPGRLEKVDNLQDLNLFVDYAHTPDALEKVLECLQEIKPKGGRLLTVFGCGGDRDKGKRPLMGEVADQYSEYSWITSDNPRTEDPLAICKEIAAGFKSSSYTISIDRKEAIEKAVATASPKDLILIAGKGHETYQLFERQTIPFDDRRVAQEIANRMVMI